MSLTGKWVELINRAATGDTRYKIIFTPIVGGLYFCFILFFIIISTRTDAFCNFTGLFDCSINRYVSIPVIIAGFLLMLYSIIHFLKVKGTPVPLSPPPTLVTSGPYRYARNPMLTGIFVQLFGIAILIKSLSLFFAFTPLFILINVWELKKIEEPELEKRLGSGYREYKNRVPMFFPWRRNKL